MKCFVVNLDRDKERLETTRAMFSSAGMDFERIDAVDARAMTAAELHKACPRFRFYIANARRVKPGEIGCALSHRKTWATVVERNLPLAAVFEDDILVDMDVLKNHLAAVEAANDPAVPTVWLMNHGLPKPDRMESAWYDVREADGRVWAWGAYCYALNTAAARRLVELLTPMANVCDAWSTFARCGVRVLAAADASATTRDGPSTIARKSGGLWSRAWYRHFYWFRYRFALWLDVLLKRITCPSACAQLREGHCEEGSLGNNGPMVAIQVDRQSVRIFSRADMDEQVERTEQEPEREL